MPKQLKEYNPKAFFKLHLTQNGGWTTEWVYKKMSAVNLNALARKARKKLYNDLKKSNEVKTNVKNTKMEWKNKGQKNTEISVITITLS